MNAAQAAKFAYIKLNIQTPCPPRGAVPVNQRCVWSSSLCAPGLSSVMNATAPAMLEQAYRSPPRQPIKLTGLTLEICIPPRLSHNGGLRSIGRRSPALSRTVPNWGQRRRLSVQLPQEEPRRWSGFQLGIDRFWPQTITEHLRSHRRTSR